LSEIRINNKWINHEDDLFLFFRARLILDLENYKQSLFNLNLEIHKLTDKYEFLMPLSPNYCQYHKIDKFEHYKEFLLQNQDNPELFQIKNYEFYKNNSYLNQISKMYFKDNKGDLISKYVHYLSNGYYGDPVVVESKLEMNEKDLSHKYSYVDCPLRIHSRTSCKLEDKIEVGFIIESHCSIWLDKTPNFKFMNKDGEVTFFEFSDNKEIAYQNTPRLNSFLRDLKALILKYGGSCTFYDYASYLESNDNIKSKIDADNRQGLLLENKLIYQEDV